MESWEPRRTRHPILPIQSWNSWDTCSQRKALNWYFCFPSLRFFFDGRPHSLGLDVRSGINAHANHIARILSALLPQHLFRIYCQWLLSVLHVTCSFPLVLLVCLYISAFLHHRHAAGSTYLLHLCSCMDTDSVHFVCRGPCWSWSFWSLKRSTADVRWSTTEKDLEEARTVRGLRLRFVHSKFRRTKEIDLRHTGTFWFLFLSPNAAQEVAKTMRKQEIIQDDSIMTQDNWRHRIWKHPMTNPRVLIEQLPDTECVNWKSLALWTRVGAYTSKSSPTFKFLLATLFATPLGQNVFGVASISTWMRLDLALETLQDVLALIPFQNVALHQSSTLNKHQRVTLPKISFQSVASLPRKHNFPGCPSSFSLFSVLWLVIWQKSHDCRFLWSSALLCNYHSRKNVLDKCVGCAICCGKLWFLAWDFYSPWNNSKQEMLTQRIRHCFFIRNWHNIAVIHMLTSVWLDQDFWWHRQADVDNFSWVDEKSCVTECSHSHKYETSDSEKYTNTECQKQKHWPWVTVLTELSTLQCCFFMAVLFLQRKNLTRDRNSTASTCFCWFLCKHLPDSTQDEDKSLFFCLQRQLSPGFSFARKQKSFTSTGNEWRLFFQHGFKFERFSVLLAWCVHQCPDNVFCIHVQIPPAMAGQWRKRSMATCEMTSERDWLFTARENLPLKKLLPDSVSDHDSHMRSCTFSFSSVSQECIHHRRNTRHPANIPPDWSQSNFCSVVKRTFPRYQV